MFEDAAGQHFVAGVTSCCWWGWRFSKEMNSVISKGIYSTFPCEMNSIISGFLEIYIFFY